MVNIMKNILIKLQMLLRLHKKKSKKQQKVVVISLETKSQIKLQGLPKVKQRI